VIPCRSTEAASLIMEYLHQLETDRIQAWKDTEFPAGLAEALRSAGIELIHQHDPAIKVGITGAHGAIVDSGTLVITGGADFPLSASLVPESTLPCCLPARFTPA